MRKIFPGIVAFSLFLWACGDDSSSGSASNHQSSSGNYGAQMTLGKCLDDGLGVFAKEADSDELDKAYLVQESDGCQVMIPALGDYCDVMAKFYSRRLGDTLEIWYDRNNAAFTSCYCMKDHWFDISCGDTDAKYFKYSGQAFRMVDEPAPVSPEPEEPVIPDAPEFSESEPHQEVMDVIGYCDAMLDENENLLSNKFLYVDAWNDFSERDSNGVGAPFARTHYDGDDVVLVFEETFNCDEKVEKVNVYPSNDTLYAKPEMTKLDSVKLEPGEGCACMTRAAFKLKNEGVYAEAKYMVFGNHMEYVYTLKPGTEK